MDSLGFSVIGKKLFRFSACSLLLASLSLLFLLQANCTGTDFGVDGPDVIPREEAISKIETARLIRFAACNQTTDIQLELVNNSGKKDREKLEGAFYAISDVDSCVRGVYLTPCENAVSTCKLSPKDFLEGKLFQGGF